MQQYSPEVQAFLKEHAKENTGIRFNPAKLRLVGKDPNKDNADKAGKFFIKKWNDLEKKYGEDEPFCPGDKQEFTGVILEVLYYAKWKYQEGSSVTYRTREFKGFRDEPVELLKLTYGKDGNKSEMMQVFHDYSVFKAKFSGEDDFGMKKIPPYDLWAALYIWHPATNQVLKYEIKGQTRSQLFDYDRAWRRALPDAQALFQILTHFEVDKDNIGQFNVGGFVEPEKMETVMQEYKALQEWRKSWKKANTEPPKEEVLPTIQVPVEDSVSQSFPSDEVNTMDVPF